MIVTCNVIGDLLPLYADGICSDDTKTVVEHHVAECESCKKKLEAMTAPVEKPPDAADASPPENPFKKVRRRYTRLVAVTLIICAVVLIPSLTVFKLSVSEETGQGISFSTVKTWRELHKFARAMDRGDYSEALDMVDIANQDDYTAEEVAEFREIFAEDLSEYFQKYPIKKVRTYAEHGESEGGNVALYVKEQINTSFEHDSIVEISLTRRSSGRFYISGIYAFFEPSNVSNEVQHQMYSALNYALPRPGLIPKDSAQSFFERLFVEGKSSFYLYTEEDVKLRYGEDGELTSEGILARNEFREKRDELLKSLVEDYDYVGCEGGDVFYRIYPVLLEGTPMEDTRYYTQDAVITMRTHDGAEFTVSFSLPVSMLSWPQAYSSLQAIHYSEGTPDDFKLRFEEIFT